MPRVNPCIRPLPGLLGRLGLLALLCFPAGAALAQDGAGEAAGGPRSFARMFFWSDSLLGLIIIWLLVVMSIATIALLIHFLLQNRKATIMPEEVVADLEGLLSERKFRDAIELAEEDESVFAEVVHAALAEASNGFGAMERAVEETGDLAATRKVRAIELLNVFGAVGPMIGLFGTVYGMIVAFQTIVEQGGQPSPEELAAGISTALVTTFWGLIVGIPAVAAAALIRNRVEGLVTEAMVEADQLIGRFRPGGGKKKAGGEPAERGERPAPASPKPRAE